MLFEKGVIFECDSMSDYERGAHDAWELARKIANEPTDGGYTIEEVHAIFGASSYEVFKTYKKYCDVMAKVIAYEDMEHETEECPLTKLLSTIESMQKVDISLSDLVYQMHWRVKELEKKVNSLACDDGK